MLHYTRHELWRCEYYKNPYLILEEDETILERFADIFTNSLDISTEGMVTPGPMMENDARLSRYFTEIIEETNRRGILHKDSMQPAFTQINEYYRNGDPPIGVHMFKDLPIVQKDHLYKFSKREFVRDMYEHGRFRISPASYYAKGSHLRAVKDLETERNYRLKAIHDVINGRDSVEVSGEHVSIVNGIVQVSFNIDDYFLFSTCKELSRRMPTDFESDAVLIIKRKREFIDRFKFELEQSYPGWEFLERDVYYYDAYHDLPKERNQEFYKHISYAYQKEHRCILRPRYTGLTSSQFSPFFVELGSLSDIAEVVYA